VAALKGCATGDTSESRCKPMDVKLDCSLNAS
jgi:hypothetical protein